MVTELRNWIVFLSLAAFPVAGWAAERAFELPEKHGAFVIDVPDAWNATAQGTGGVPPTIFVKPKMGSTFQVLMTPLWTAAGRPLPEGEQLRGFVMKAAGAAQAQAVEQRIDVKELKGEGAYGFYFSATDKDPKQGEYRHLTQGVLRVGALMATFTVLTNDNQAAVVERALAMLRNAKHRPAGPGP